VSSSDKEDQIHKSFSGERAWFADFIIGERRLMDGDRDRALEAFWSSYESIKQLPHEPRPAFDELMIDFVKARLYDLQSGSARPDATSSMQSGGQNK
jgi:hypothetical protein